MAADSHLRAGEGLGVCNTRVPVAGWTHAVLAIPIVLARFVRVLTGLRALKVGIPVRDPGIAEATTLKLTLQPLVENALYHGIKSKRGGGTI